MKTSVRPFACPQAIAWLLWDSSPVQDFVHLHAGWIPVVAEADDDHAVFLGQDGLVHLPAIVQMRQHVRHFPVFLRFPLEDESQLFFFLSVMAKHGKQC